MLATPPNKLGIGSVLRLDKATADLAAQRLIELELSPLQGRFDRAHLQATHAYIFQDLFHDAGQLADMGNARSKTRISEVSGTPRTVHYPPADPSQVDQALSTHASPEALSAMDHKAFAKSLATLYADLDALRPFTYGNSVTMRAFTAQLARAAGRPMNWGAQHVNAEYRDALYAARDAAVLSRGASRPTGKPVGQQKTEQRSTPAAPSLEQLLERSIPLLRTRASAHSAPNFSARRNSQDKSR